jgi:tetratricopeptide (TPR) repeat protein
MQNNLTKRFSVMMEQAKKWDSSNLSEGKKTHRYLNLISFIEEKILPFTRNNAGFKADVHKGLGYLYDMTSNPEKASENFRQAKRIFTKIKDRKGLAETYIRIGDMHRDYGHFNQALTSYQKAIRVSRNIPELSNFKAESLLGIGDLHRLRANYEQALQNLRGAKAIYRRNKSTEGVSEVLWIEGYTHIYTGQYAKAEKAFTQIIRWHEQGEVDETHRSTATGALGDIYRLTGKYEQSLALYREAEESMDIEGNQSGRAWILAMMGHSYLQLDNLQEAKRSILKAENLSRKMNNGINLVWALQAKAETQKLEGRTDDAKNTYRESQSIARKYGLKLETAHSRLGLATLSYKKGNPLYEKALRIYKDIGCRWGVRECNIRMKTREGPPLNYP